jgi:hypothetical protein
MLTQLLLACVLSGFTPSQDCLTIEDSSRRSFEELGPIAVDVDGDGKPDTITPRIYATRKRGKRRENHWITFDLNPTRGLAQRSFFRYKYGTDEADYWVYALVPCDVNKDGELDLVFYSGDDTSDETVVLLNRGGVFRVHSRSFSEGND